ncbi:MULTISPECIES: hypothetical protein [unclassified Pseudophaeobacter]|uniref:hypothetical protein n=1 Tax=unclassified Pseudophaeobacter TaxID=2637024 RepID=UPI000EFBD2BA|nr:hypothetical protein [Pseudophaeobacter sp. EL27]
MQHARALITFALILAAGPSLGDVIGPGGKVIDCYCTDKTGSRVDLGEIRCLDVDGRQFLAQCQMSLNVPMWREVQANCLSADLGEPSTASYSVALAQLPDL